MRLVDGGLRRGSPIADKQQASTGSFLAWRRTRSRGHYSTVTSGCFGALQLRCFTSRTECPVGSTTGIGC
jgi:hypothetical protein